MLTNHPFNNVTENIFQKLGANLHLRPDHPLSILKEAIYAYFDSKQPDLWRKFDDLRPVVTTKAVGCPQFLLSLTVFKLLPSQQTCAWQVLHAF